MVLPRPATLFAGATFAQAPATTTTAPATKTEVKADAKAEKVEAKADEKVSKAKAEDFDAKFFKAAFALATYEGSVLQGQYYSNY